MRAVPSCEYLLLGGQDRLDVVWPDVGNSFCSPAAALAGSGPGRGGQQTHSNPATRPRAHDHEPYEILRACSAARPAEYYVRSEKRTETRRSGRMYRAAKSSNIVKCHGKRWSRSFFLFFFPLDCMRGGARSPELAERFI